MIVKELEAFCSNDPMLQAGRAAEETMSFYLRRAFKDAAETLVLNNLRLVTDEDAAQIDHLVLHRYGMVIIESKSVTGKVRINEMGEWIRRFGQYDRGMPSPVQQARRQAEFLKRYINPHAAEIRGKLFGMMQMRFGIMPIGVLVAISDSGIIEGSRKTVPEVHKADQIVDEVRALLKEHKRINSPFNPDMKEFGDCLKLQELDALSNFLLRHHRPAGLAQDVPVRMDAAPPAAAPGPDTVAARPSAAAPVMSPVIAPRAVREETAAYTIKNAAGASTCRHCGSGFVAVEWGKYGYYFKCRTCFKNTPINVICQCGAREKIHKSGADFSSRCERCNKSRFFFSGAPSHASARS